MQAQTQNLQAAQSAQNNQSNMTANRNQLSDKELHYIKDFLSWELLAMKKCSDTANQCSDPQIQNILRQTGQKHIQHYETILSHLQS